MSRLALISPMLGLLIFLFITPPLLAQDPLPKSAPPRSGTLYIPGEILVKFRPAVSRLSGQHRLAAAGLRTLQVATYSGLMRVQVTPGREADIVAQLWARGGVEWVGLNQILSGSGSPNDTDFTLQWGLNNTGQSGGTVDADIDAPEGWDIETGAGSVIIAIIDSGVDLDHPDLQANIWINSNEIPGNGQDDDNNGYADDVNGWNFCNTTTTVCGGTDDNDPSDEFNHGTHVAGIAAAVGNNNLGVAGVSWNSKIMAVKVLDENNNGSIFSITQGIDYAVANGANIINLSLGAAFSQYPCLGQEPIQRAMQNAVKNGVLVTAAAGNQNYSKVSCPAAFDEALAVGATTHTDARSSFSNKGDRLDVVAPGGNGVSPFGADDIYSTTNDGNYGYLAGTSMSTPFVSGLAALLWSYNPDLSNNDVRSIIEATVDDLGTVGFDTNFGHGRINTRRALEALASLQASPSQIDLTLTEGQFPATETIKLGSSDAGDVSWTAILSPTVSWLNLPMSAGTVSAISPATVSLDFTLPSTFGVYSTTVVISGTNEFGLSLGRRSTTVRLSYQDISTLLQTSPAEIKVTLGEGDSPIFKTIQLTSTELNEVNWTAIISPTVSWLGLSALAGTVSADSPTTLPLTFTHPVTFGTYNSSVIISGTSSSNLSLGQRVTTVTLTYQTGRNKYYRYLPLLLKQSGGIGGLSIE